MGTATTRLGIPALGLLFVCSLALGDETPRLEVPFTDEVPEMDELMGMELPARFDGKFAKVSEFIQRVPNDGAQPTYPTEVHVAYDRKHLYAIFIAFDDEPEKLRANMSPREQVFGDDSVNIMIDTFNDQRRAYFFLCNPLGVQSDGQFIEGGGGNGGPRGFDGSFAAVWESEGRLTDRGFVVKMTIPFKSIRFPDREEQTWRVIFNRMNQRLSEDNFWPRYTLAIEGRLNQTALMTGIRGISPGRNIQLVPFGFFRDLRVEEDSLTGKSVDDGNEEAVGLDAKMILKDALVLDVTANPDFSQVEADEPQVTVNQRFEVFFPERRPFFLENSDVFRTPTNLFFTRRVVDPSGGVKLTGKQGKYAVAMLLSDDEAPGKSAEAGDPLEGESASVGVLRLARDISAQSKLGVMLTDRELADGYNRVGAVDGRIKVNGNWVAQFQVAAAATRQLIEDSDVYEELDGVSYNAFIDRSGTHLTTHSHYLYTSEGFNTDLGFLGGQQRVGVQDLHQRASYRFRPENSKLTDWGPSFMWGRVWDTSGNGLDWRAESEMEWNWAANTEIEIGYEHSKVTLLPEEFEDLTGPEEYSQNSWDLDFGSDRWTRVGFDVSADFGTRINFVPPEGEEPELADFLRTQASLLWRPLSPLRLDFSYIRTELENRDGSGTIFTNSIGRVRANWQFTKELSLRLITDIEDTDPVAGETSLTDDEQLRVDALLRYLWNPWKALYVGYTSSRRDFQELDENTMLLMDLEDEGRQIFVKFSYLFQL